jgi:hypothetical protein
MPSNKYKNNHKTIMQSVIQSYYLATTAKQLYFIYVYNGVRQAEQSLSGVRLDVFKGFI